MSLCRQHALVLPANELREAVGREHRWHCNCCLTSEETVTPGPARYGQRISASECWHRRRGLEMEGRAG